MRVKGTFITGVLTAALACGVAGCGSSSKTSSPATTSGPAPSTAPASASASGRKLNIWYVNPLTSYPDWATSGQLFTSYAASHGIQAHMVGPNVINIPQMIQLMAQAVADHADGIITCDLDPKTFASAISAARKAGVVVVSIGCVDNIANYSVGTDNTTFGREAADVIAANAGKNARVGILVTDQATPNQVQQVHAFTAETGSKYPGMKVVGVESDKSNTATAATKITALAEANPNLNAIWCVEGTCPAAVQPGLSAAGRRLGQVFALGIDNVAATLAAIKAGWVKESLNQCYFQAVPLAVQLIRDAKMGKPASKKFYPVPVDPVTTSKLPYKNCPVNIVPQVP